MGDSQMTKSVYVCILKILIVKTSCFPDTKILMMGSKNGFVLPKAPYGMLGKTYFQYLKPICSFTSKMLATEINCQEAIFLNHNKNDHILKNLIINILFSIF